jgi:hypothetical protein
MKLSGQLQAPAALSLGNSLWYPLYRWPGDPQSGPGHSGGKKFYHYRKQNPGRPAHSQSLCPMLPQRPAISQFIITIVIRFFGRVYKLQTLNMATYRALVPVLHGQSVADCCYKAI